MSVCLSVCQIVQHSHDFVNPFLKNSRRIFKLHYSYLIYYSTLLSNSQEGWRNFLNFFNIKTNFRYKIC